MDSSLIGVDFSSAPNTRKPICVARGHRRGDVVVLDGVTTCTSLEALANVLREGAWIGGFDLPFGLPRELVVTLGWPQDWLALMRHYTSLSRDEIRATFKQFCDARPAGAKFAHRACDPVSGASPSMKWVNPPVALMMHAGVPLLLDAGAHLPGLHEGTNVEGTQRIALEAYPGLLARELIARRSYKSDTVAKQNDERFIARKDLIEALELGRSRLGLRLKLTHAQRDALAADARGDRLDAVLCLMQVAWAAPMSNYGLPADMDPLEGWIITSGSA